MRHELDIAVQVPSSSFPTIDPSPGPGGSLLEPAAVVATQRVPHDVDHRSAIAVPVVPPA